MYFLFSFCSFMCGQSIIFEAGAMKVLWKKKLGKHVE